MKANQAFRNDDDGVSPVIAVILMVAITVVLAATVYVWVSSFGAQQQAPARAIALTSNAPMDSDGDKTFTISSASSGFKWQDVYVTIDGERLTHNATAACSADAAATEFIVCGTSSGSFANEDASKTIDAGDQLKINSSSGKTLRILDGAANSVLLTLVLG